jgi:hypothetical protein
MNLVTQPKAGYTITMEQDMHESISPTTRTHFFFGSQNVAMHHTIAREDTEVHSRLE